MLGDKSMSDEEITEFLASLRKLLGKFLDDYFHDEFSDDEV